MTSLSLNVGNFVTLKLTQTNYPLWREQVLGLAESQDLVDHITKGASIPTKYNTPAANTTEAENTTPQLTQEFIAWQKSDRLLRGWIIGTLSEEALGLVIGLDTTLTVWEALKEAYAQDSQEREFTLRQQLVYLRKDDNKSIKDHIYTFKNLCDNLAGIGKPLPDKEKVFCLLTSLGPQYETFTTTMLKPPRPTYTELTSQLQNLDQRRNWFSNQTDTPFTHLTPHLAFYGQQQRQPFNTAIRNRNTTFNSSGRGFQAQQARNQNQSYSTATIQPRRPPPPGERRMTTAERDLYRNETCQYCGKTGHTAKICWWIPKRGTQNDEIPQALAALTLDNSITESEWTADTGASNHMTGQPGMLTNIHEYSGSDVVIIGDGSSIPITGTGTSSIKQKDIKLPLYDVLLVPELEKNLLSVNQLTSQYPVNCDFSDLKTEYVNRRG